LPLFSQRMNAHASLPQARACPDLR